MSNPWDRQRLDGELEPMLWFERFTAFRLMGPGRKLLACINEQRRINGHKESHLTPGSWRKESKKWNWHTRAESYDIAEHERVKLERAAEKEEWSRKRWTAANKLYDKGNELLALPVIDTSTVERNDDGQPIKVEIKGIGSRLAEVARVFKAADDLARITTGEPLPTIKQDIKTDGTVTIEYTGNVSPDEL